MAARSDLLLILARNVATLGGMKQSVFGLPPFATIPKSASPAYRRLMTTLRGAGWNVLPTPEARVLGYPFLDLEHAHFPTEPWGEEGESSDAFELKLTPGEGVLLRYDRSLSLGLEEIRRQFVAVHVERVQEHLRPMRWRPKVPLRAVRIDREACLRKSIFYDLEKYAGFGINAVLIDALDPPSTNGALADESRSAGWESRLRHTLEGLGKRALWRMPVLPFELDLASERPGKDKALESPLCRQGPRGRRRLLHRFESLIRLFPQVEAVGLTVADWDRCPCDLCRKISFQEEVAYYLRGYFAVLKRYAPETALWILPDENSWEALQEVGPQVPEGVRWLYVSESEQSAIERMEWGRAADGIQFALHSGMRGGFLDTTVFRRLDSAIGTEREPQLAVAMGDFSGVPPVQFAAFLRSIWEIDGETQDLEEWLYRLALPSTEWRNWKSWKADNELLKRCWTAPPRNGEGRMSAPTNGAQRPRNGQPVRDSQKIDGPFLRSRVAEVAQRNGRTPYALSPGPHLIHDLVASANRWLAESEIASILSRLDAMPEAAPIDGKLTGMIADLRDGLNEFLESSYRLQFEIEELRGLESLRDHLALLLGKERRREIWNKNDLPELFMDLAGELRSKSLG